MRYFEKISFNQFKKDVKDDEKMYKEYILPKRSTKYSAGYDIFLLEDCLIRKNEIVKIPTGLKANMNKDEVLLLVMRSSLGFKYNLRLCNQIGVIDKDYYNNKDNEGHFFIKMQNEGEEDLYLKKGDKIIQGIFIKYLVVDNEEKVQAKRIGGIGSTNL